MDCWNVSVLVNIQIDEFLCFVRDVIFLKRAVHIKRTAKTFPCITSCVFVQFMVPVKDLVEALLATNVNNVVVFCVEINNTKFSCFLC